MFFERIYAPFIVSKPVRIVVLSIFITGLIISTMFFIPRMEIGLDQRIAMPDDSYVYKYFTVQK